MKAGKIFTIINRLVVVMYLLSGVYTYGVASGTGTAQPLTNDPQRYLALMLLNLGPERENDINLLQTGNSFGMNAVYLTIPWDQVYYNSPTETPRWAKYDEQIQLASRLGMKVGIRVHVGRNIDRINGFWTRDDCLTDFNKQPLIEVYGGTSFRYDHEPSVQKATGFVKEVVERYKWLHQEGKLLFVSVTNTPQQEAGYPFNNLPPSGDFSKAYLSIFDYSPATVRSFQQWLANRYRKIQRLNLLWGTRYTSFSEAPAPAAPWSPNESFGSRYGRDWYIFRHEVLKAYTNRMVDAVKGVDKGIKFISDYGSVFDAVSNVRGTVAFGDLNERTDGIKINDDHHYDHHYSMDVLRGQLSPNHFYANEVFYSNWLIPDDYIKQFNENFKYGANMIAFVLSSVNDMRRVESTIRTVSSTWLNEPIRPIIPQDTLTYRMSRSVEWNILNTTYNDWRRVSRRGTPEARPVQLTMINDLLSEDYWREAANRPPYLLNPLPMRIVAVGRDFTYRIPNNTFADADGTIVRIEVPNLPSWLRYENGEIRGRSDVMGDTRIMVRAIDDEGGIVEAFFTIRVDTRENANQPPTVRENFPRLVIKVDEPFTFALPKEAFVDPDGTITRVEASDLPGWLTFTNGQLRGTPRTTGEYRIFVKAYDDMQAFVETFFVIQVVEPQFFNNPPYTYRTIPVKFAKVNEPFTFALPHDTFVDSDGYISLITVQNLPTWLTFSFNVFSGTPPEEGEYRLVVRAYDNAGAYAETIFILKVEVPYLTFDLLQSGRTIDRKKLRTLANGDVIPVDSLPSLLNIYTYGNFEFDRVNLQLNGPYRYESQARKFPHSLFREGAGFAPYVGHYTLSATAYNQDSLIITNTIQFSISAGDSLNIGRDLSEWQAYPNPFDRVFNIKLPDASPATNYDFTLITVSGQRLPISAQKIAVHDSIAQIDLSDFTLASGIYFIRLEENGELVKLFKVFKR
ncbi:putative Ig domain-containing protein [Telluribacter sp. SYSU D00476]|uniref:putative Ig domain-containing protein n=1 Tax=Telluribacter sp. SYSU D00476 TaxID=2811430 RepID=UPI001FF33C15|nr:putative Ig domain-containing protein [Telluribacter sp. SYSU D00476]